MNTVNISFSISSLFFVYFDIMFPINSKAAVQWGLVKRFSPVQWSTVQWCGELSATSYRVLCDYYKYSSLHWLPYLWYGTGGLSQPQQITSVVMNRYYIRSKLWKNGCFISYSLVAIYCIHNLYWTYLGFDCIRQY